MLNGYFSHCTCKYVDESSNKIIRDSFNANKVIFGNTHLGEIRLFFYNCLMLESLYV